MIIQQIKKELSSNVDSKYKKDVAKYFKEGIQLLGVRTPYVRQVSNIYFKKIKNQSKQEILDVCEQMLEQPYNEFSTIAFDWTFKLKKKLEVSDFDRFEVWIEKYVHNWGRCDDFCTHTIHYFIESFPEVIPRIKAWAYSKNMWFRRASAVSFITSKKGWFIAKHTLQDVFDISLILLKDEEDLVQKGYGWMLKSASTFDQKAVFDFVMKHKKDMHRTALRYAIEYMPKDLKQKAMKKD